MPENFYISYGCKKIIWGIGRSASEALEDSKININNSSWFFDGIYNSIKHDIRKKLSTFIALNGCEEDKLITQIVKSLRKREIKKLKTIYCTKELYSRIEKNGSDEIKWTIKREKVADLDLLATFGT